MDSVPGKAGYTNSLNSRSKASPTCEYKVDLNECDHHYLVKQTFDLSTHETTEMVVVMETK